MTPNHSGYLPKFSLEQSTFHFGLQSNANCDNEKEATEDLYFDSEASQEVRKIVNSTSEKGSGISLAVTSQIRTVPSVEDSERYEVQVSVVRRKFTSSSMPNFETPKLFSKTNAYSGSAEESSVDHTPTNSTLTFVTHTKPTNWNTNKSAVPYSLIPMEISEETISPGDLRNIFRSEQPNPVKHLASIYFELQPTLGDTEAFSDGVRFSECEDWQPSNTESHQLSTEAHVTTTGTTTTTTHFKPIPAGTLQTTRNTNLAKQTPEDDEKQHSTDHTQQTDSYPNNRTSSERVVSIRNLSDKIVGSTMEFDNSIQTTTSQTVGGSTGRSDIIPSSDDGRPSSSLAVSVPATPTELGYSTTTVGLNARTSLLQTASGTVLGNSILAGQSDTPKTVVSSNTTVSFSTRNTEALGKSESVLHTHNATQTGTGRRTQTTVGVSAMSDGKTDVRQQETRSSDTISTVKTSPQQTSVAQQTLHSTLTTA
ncbi:hypothetical protein CRM22_005990, partial [Opisthorchis felineus]